MTLRVTVEDLETGDTETKEVAEGDYVLVCHDPCYLHYVQKFPSKGTHQLTIKGHTKGHPHRRARREARRAVLTPTSKLLPTSAS